MPESLSPRAKWMKENGLVVVKAYLLNSKAVDWMVENDFIAAVDAVVVVKDVWDLRLLDVCGKFPPDGDDDDFLAWEDDVEDVMCMAGTGDTEEDACVDWAWKNNRKDWRGVELVKGAGL